jgi:V8-like Glu-specific endopeptidase
MIGDATIEVTCDHQPYCEAGIVISPEYVYTASHVLTGQTGHYNTDKRALRKLIEAQDWLVADDDRTTYCEAHAPAQEI